MKLNIKERISKATDAILDFNARKAGRALAYPVTAPIKAINKRKDEAERHAQQKLAEVMGQAMITAMHNTGLPFMEQAHDAVKASKEHEPDPS